MGRLGSPYGNSYRGGISSSFKLEPKELIRKYCEAEACRHQPENRNCCPSKNTKHHEIANTVLCVCTFNKLALGISE